MNNGSKRSGSGSPCLSQSTFNVAKLRAVCQLGSSEFKRQAAIQAQRLLECLVSKLFFWYRRGWWTHDEESKCDRNGS